MPKEFGLNLMTLALKGREYVTIEKHEY